MFTSSFKIVSASILIGLVAVSCKQTQSDSIQSSIVISPEEAVSPPAMSQYNINAYPLNKLVCDPFDPNPVPSPKHGIKSSLWYRGVGQARYYSVLDFISKYVPSEQNLFFNSINVPTRMFSQGFPLESGGKVKNDLDQDLVEYFALKFESQITLGANDSEGLYELAVLSDDGAILKLKEPNAEGVVPANWETHINNDGDTPTRMKCSSRLIDMKKDKKIPMELLYYQGPKFHIANMVIWRKASQAGQDSLCNHSGNSLFFNPDNNSQPVKWLDLAARGWKVLGSENYLLPEIAGNEEGGDTDYNACYNGTPPKITDFRVIEQLSVDISFSWRTDIRAISQMMVTNLDTGERTVTETDNVLRTNHQIMISGLQNNTRYRFQVIAISEDLGRGISSAIELTTF